MPSPAPVSNWAAASRLSRLLRRAADLAPEDVGYLSTLYAVLNGLGRPEDAIATAREAVARCERQLARHPDYTVAAFTGAGALAILGERERALDWAQRALAIEPDDHMTLYNVACVYAVLGMPDEAIACSTGHAGGLGAPAGLDAAGFRHGTAARPPTLRRVVRDASASNPDAGRASVTETGPLASSQLDEGAARPCARA